MVHHRHRIDPLRTTFVLLWLITGAALLPGILRAGMFRAGMLCDGAVQNQRPLSGTINPNTASWWELSLLPEIGEITARRIVQYRLEASRKVEDDGPAFGKANDLTLIRGIGPKTVAKIAPYLNFGE